MSTLEAARSAAERARDGCPRDSRAVAIVIQHGRPAAHFVFDRHRIIPGIRGGWSATVWRTVERLPQDERNPRAAAIERVDFESSELRTERNELNAQDVESVIRSSQFETHLSPQPSHGHRPTYARWRWRLWSAVALGVVAWYVMLTLLV